eukprot:1194907-Prorocentrum_minimum.AAC.1
MSFETDAHRFTCVKDRPTNPRPRALSFDWEGRLARRVVRRPRKERKRRGALGRASSFLSAESGGTDPQCQSMDEALRPEAGGPGSQLARNPSYRGSDFQVRRNSRLVELFDLGWIYNNNDSNMASLLYFLRRVRHLIRLIRISSIFTSLPFFRVCTFTASAVAIV